MPTATSTAGCAPKCAAAAKRPATRSSPPQRHRPRHDQDHQGLQPGRARGRPVTWTWHEIRALPPSTLAAQLQADHYIDSSAEDPGAALQKLGGAAAIIATAASGASISPLVGRLAPRGRMVVVGTAPDPIEQLMVSIGLSDIRFD